MEETQRQNLVQAFSNVLRTSGLVGVVDLQRAALAFASLLQQTPDGAPVPLGPLYDYLLENRGPEPAVREVIVFLKSRESRFSLSFQLPPQLAGLSLEEQQKILVAFTARGATSGTLMTPCDVYIVSSGRNGTRPENATSPSASRTVTSGAYPLPWR